ncbi:MAG: hypothetical protein MZV70_17585 [Desulfobacterales bacterium]|nr:hypothetical protein [Desulfobacterales bacterium]
MRFALQLELLVVFHLFAEQVSRLGCNNGAGLDYPNRTPCFWKLILEIEEDK